LDFGEFQMTSEVRTIAERRELGRIRAEAISAIEGQVLTDEQRKRFAEWDAAALTPEQQRVEILRLYKRDVDLK
jgi:hypothetical protein